jgi:hypothetical protein
LGREFFIFAFGVFRTLDEMFLFEGRVFLAAITGVILAAETAVGDDTTSGKTVLGVGALMGIALTLIILSLRRIRDQKGAQRRRAFPRCRRVRRRLGLGNGYGIKIYLPVRPFFLNNFQLSLK